MKNNLSIYPQIRGEKIQGVQLNPVEVSLEQLLSLSFNRTPMIKYGGSYRACDYFEPQDKGLKKELNNLDVARSGKFIASWGNSYLWIQSASESTATEVQHLEIG